MLARIMRLYLIVDFRKLTVQPPPSPVYLLDWIPPSAAARMSPIFLPPSDGLDLITIVEQAWGKDAMACVYSEWDTPQVLAHLRVAARGQYHPTVIPKPEHMLGFCNPSSLRPLIANCTPKFARHLFSGIGAILIESESPETWDLLAGIGFSVKLADVQDPAVRQLFGHDDLMAPRRRAKRPSTLLGRRRSKTEEFRGDHR